MSYIGNAPTSVAFLTDQFSGTGSTTVFVMSVAPASTGSILVCITGVTQDPSTYAISGTTLTFSQAPPVGTGNISVRYLGIPASNIATTAYRTVTDFTATLAQTIFTVPSYTVGFIDVYRNGARLGLTDFTATNGTIVVLANAATAGDLITTESFYVSNVLNAIPSIAGAVSSSHIVPGVALTTPVLGTPVSGSLENCNNVNYTGFKNRIINGGMVIDQRNAGAVVTPVLGAATPYTLDRWSAVGSVSSKYSVQQNAGSVTPPVGFSNYLGVTSLSAYSVLAADYFFIKQTIEGFNFADMAMGTASASTVTLSFQVRSSLTGTFGGSLQNPTQNRSYLFSYSIPVANTWTTISITISGETTGTWAGAANGVGVYVMFGLGIGTTQSGTAGSWQTGNLISATGATSVVGTLGATFYITGVQLEKGSVATSFDYRDYGRELAMCQRYYQTALLRLGAYASAAGQGVTSTMTIAPMRTAPTPTFTAGTNGNLSSLTFINWATNSGGVAMVATAAGLVFVSDYTVFFSTEL